MSFEKKVVAAALSDRNAYARISAATDTDSGFSPYSSILLKFAGRYYEKDEKAQAVDGDVLLEYIKTTVPENKQELYTHFFNEVRAINVSALNVAEIVVEAKRKHIAGQLAVALTERGEEKKVDELIDSYRSLSDKIEEEEEEQYNNVSIDEMAEEISDESGRIRLLPNELNKIAKNKTKRGHHIVIYARPETGKTAISLTLAWGFCLQGLSGIIFGNEEPVKDTILRAMCCFSGMKEEEILADKKKAQAMLDARGWNNLRFIPLNPGTPRQIDKYLERYKPDFFIVDQIRNLFVGGETRVNQLEMAATAMRNLGKKHNAIAVSITQAGDSADNKLVLDMGDIDFSNTGIPATADLMIGMGVNKEYEAQGLRVLNTPKNKIGGMHVNFPVRINQDISRIEDL